LGGSVLIWQQTYGARNSFRVFPQILKTRGINSALRISKQDTIWKALKTASGSTDYVPGSQQKPS